MLTQVDWGGPKQEYRYTLWRIWNDEGPILQYIGLNPSTADEHQDDPTIRRCIGFAKRWGYGSICMTNLFAWRDTKPENMKKASDPVGPENDWFLQEVASISDRIIACWGNHGTFMDRDQVVRKMLPEMFALKLNEKTGQPGHPLYVHSETIPVLL